MTTRDEEACPACGSTELRLDPTTGDVDCTDCGATVVEGPLSICGAWKHPADTPRESPGGPV